MIPNDRRDYNAATWWRDLQPDPVRKNPGDRAGDRAALARLRRCATIAEAMQEPATLALFRRLSATQHSDLPTIALTAAVLAHVRTDSAKTAPGQHVARQVGPTSLDEPNTATLKPLRFRRLMEAEGEDRLAAFRRLVAIAGGTLPVQDLAAALLDWSESRRIRWVFDYWNPVAPAATTASPNPTTKDATP